MWGRRNLPQTDAETGNCLFFSVFRRDEFESLFLDGSGNCLMKALGQHKMLGFYGEKITQTVRQIHLKQLRTRYHFSIERVPMKFTAIGMSECQTPCMNFKGH